MKVYCKNCKYFNRRNLCSQGGKQTNSLTLFVNKMYMRTVYAEGKCNLYKRKRLWFRDKAWELKRPSIDRINTIDDYTFKNCRFIELKENKSRPKGRYK